MAEHSFIKKAGLPSAQAVRLSRLRETRDFPPPGRPEFGFDRVEIEKKIFFSFFAVALMTLYYSI